tara:strand:- start:116 stop:247 length:132 start_codon:yes stop_codon:yes gene_type:complete
MQIVCPSIVEYRISVFFFIVLQEVFRQIEKLKRVEFLNVLGPF